jgi:uncharacterized membrane protein YkvA (DUF1232 family)
MKDWKILTEEELDALTSEQVDMYVKLIYAEEGIPLVCKPEKVHIEPINPDKTVYQLNAINSIVFCDLNEAEKVAEVLKSCKSLGHTDYKSNYNEKYFVPGTPKDYTGRPLTFEVSNFDVYSLETYERVQKTLAENNAATEKMLQMQEEYERNSAARDEATEDFFKALEKAREAMEHRRSMCYKFYNDYMQIAENNTKIAMGFLKKAYIVSEADEEYIKANKPKKDEK